MRFRLFLLYPITFTLFDLGFAGTSGNVKFIYSNPLTITETKTCNVCATFYLDDSFHKYIGAVVEKTCDDGVGKDYYVFGYADAKMDTTKFTKRLQENSGKLRFIRTFCGIDAHAALELAASESNRYLDGYHRSHVLALIRFVATPILGRPCKKSAHRVRNALLDL